MKRLLQSAALFVVLFAVALSQAPATEKAGKYPFVVPATKAIEQIKDLEKVSGKTLRLHADEAKMLAEAATGKLETFTLTEAALIASGAVEPAKRKEYCEKLDSIEADARKALEGIDNIKAKGDKLLQFLHAGPMKNGYESEQTDLTVVLDTGKFNCVSSAVLYNLLAQRLGLEVKAYSIPASTTGMGHAFSVLCDGDKRIPVETTNAKGFNVSENMKRTNKHEIGDLALIATIYYNHGVGFEKKKQYHQALHANLCALALDKTNVSASKNALANLTNWGVDLSCEEKHAEALEVIRVNLELAPKDAKALQNRKAFVSQIVMKELKAKKYDEALRRIEEHKTLLGDKQTCRQLALNVHDTHAQEHREKKDWEKVVAVYVAALKSMPKDSHLTNNLVATFDEWAGKHMDSSDWTAAIRVFEQGLQHLPGNSHLTNNLRYCEEQMKRK